MISAIYYVFLYTALIMMWSTSNDYTHVSLPIQFLSFFDLNVSTLSGVCWWRHSQKLNKELVDEFYTLEKQQHNANSSRVGTREKSENELERSMWRNMNA